MVTKLREYIENGIQVIEYTRDGESVSHVVKTPVVTEPTEPVETVEEKLARMEQQLEAQSLVQLEVLATIYEELLMKG